MNKIKIRKLSIKTKILLVTNIMVIVLVVLLGFNFYRTYEEDTVQMGMEQAKISAKTAINQINIEEVSKIKVGDENTDAYQNNQKILNKVKEDCNIAYLYTLYTDGSNVYYGIDTEGSDKSDIGEIFEENYDDLKSVFEGKEYIEDYIDYTEYGDLITVYEPLTNQEGKVETILGSDYNASKIVENLDKTKKQIIQIGAIGFIVVIILLNLIVDGITKSIRLVNNKIYELVHTEGDLTQTLSIKSGDEMEVLAKNVNELLEHIRVIMLDISNNTEELNDSTKVVADDLFNAEKSIIDVSSTMEEMSAAMEETTTSINQISESVTDIYISIDNITEKSQEGNQLTEEIQDKAKIIYKEAKDDQNEAKNLAADMIDSVNKKIEESKNVEEITQLTEKILEITSQTNLLALNASIEAARAGEAGKGFSVVADEISKLATDSADAASKIKEVSYKVVSSVDGLAGEAEKLIQFMDDIAMKGYKEMLSMSENYSDDAENIHVMMDKLSHNSEKIKESMDTIQKGIKEVDIAVEESTKGIMNIAENSTELSSNIKHIQEKANVNQNVAVQLQNEVHKFKLE